MTKIKASKEIMQLVFQNHLEPLIEKVVAVLFGFVLFKFGHACSKNSQRNPSASSACFSGISAPNSFLFL